jgi:hypothetical protein
MTPCCGTVAATTDSPALSDNGYEELERMGIDVAYADRNGDGMVDDRDVMLLIVDEQMELFRRKTGAE